MFNVYIMYRHVNYTHNNRIILTSISLSRNEITNIIDIHLPIYTRHSLYLQPLFALISWSFQFRCLRDLARTAIITIIPIMCIMQYNIIIVIYGRIWRNYRYFTNLPVQWTSLYHIMVLVAANQQYKYF